jgi:hypothetical protein
MKKFTFSVNGETKQIHNARVSAFPFNRVWCGKQRSKEQTEIAYFVTFDFKDTAEIEIELLGESFPSVSIRPSKYNIDYSVKGSLISINLTEPKHFVVEVDGKSEALHVFSNDIFKIMPEENDVFFGPGEHYPGVIYPKTGQRIIIDEDAVVYGALFINQAENVKILGRGILDTSLIKRGNEAKIGHSGGELAEKLSQEGFSEKDIHYTGAVVAYGCKNLEIDGIIIRDSMFWTLTLRNYCKNVIINNVKIIGQWRYNSDGVNVCCSENVLISNCFIRSFDDCAVVRGAALEGESGDTRDVVVKNCVMWCDWGISLEVWGGGIETTIKDIYFENNYLIHLSITAIDITTWFGSNNTVINNIEYSNIFIDDDDFYPDYQFQREDNEKYIVKEESKKPKLFNLGCRKLGKNLGNQTHQPAESLDNFNLLYKNITLNKIFAKDDYEIQINPMSEVLKIENLNIDI